MNIRHSNIFFSLHGVVDRTKTVLHGETRCDSSQHLKVSAGDRHTSTDAPTGVGKLQID